VLSGLRFSRRELLGWFLLAVAVKGAYLLLLGGSPVLAGDAIVYIQSIETLIDTGTYAWDPARPETVAARMPGMLLPYGLFRLFFSSIDSQALLQCFQTLLDSFTVVAFLAFADQLGLSLRIVRAAGLLYLLSTGVSTWNHQLATESLAAAGSFLGIWICTRGLEVRKWGCLLLGGSLLAWVGFLKAFYFGWILAVAVSLAWVAFARYKASPLYALRVGLAILLPFLILLSTWTQRNLAVTGRLIPLQDGLNGGYAYPPEFVALRTYMQTIGGDFVSWNPKAEVRWFDPWAGQNLPPQPQFPPDQSDLASRVATQACNQEKLKAVRHAYRVARTTTEASVRKEAQVEASRGLAQCGHSYIAERPLEYHLVAPLRLLVAYLGHSGTYNLFPRPFSELSMSERSFKLLQSLLHAAAVLLGVPAAIWILLTSRRVPHLALPVAVATLGHTLGFPLVLRLVEYRYLVMAYPLLFLCATILVSNATQWSGAWRARVPVSGKGGSSFDASDAT
jgi:hypothetical protein